MNHFEREAYLQWLVPGSILVIGLLTALLGSAYFRAIEAARVDRCLDAGGNYDYAHGRCDFSRTPD
jgi:hypothetical protein